MVDKNQYRILVVNDKLDLRTIIRDILKDEGYTGLSVSENGQAALKKIQAERPDLIIADFDLPGLSGLDLLREVRQDRNLADTPFILISSEVQQKFVAQAAEKRVSAYIVKPFTHRTLANKVSQLLDGQAKPDEEVVLFHEANALAQAGNMEAALEKYQQALEGSRKVVAALHHKVGVVHERLDHLDEADANYRMAIDVGKFFVDAYDSLGSLLLRSDQSQEALEYFRRGTSISPLNAQRQFSLGEALLQTGDYAAAEKAFKTALNLDPQQTHAFNRLGITLRRQGKLDEAAEFFLKAVEVEPKDENLLFNLSRVFMDQGRPDAARNWLEKALAINPDFLEARNLMTEIQAATRQSSP